LEDFALVHVNLLRKIALCFFYKGRQARQTSDKKMVTLCAG